jgi:hypothetical protein
MIKYHSHNTTSTTHNTITERRHDPMLNDIKALSPGEWLYLATFAAITIIVYIVADNTY